MIGHIFTSQVVDYPITMDGDIPEVTTKVTLGRAKINKITYLLIGLIVPLITVIAPIGQCLWSHRHHQTALKYIKLFLLIIW